MSLISSASFDFGSSVRGVAGRQKLSKATGGSGCTTGFFHKRGTTPPHTFRPSILPLYFSLSWKVPSIAGASIFGELFDYSGGIRRFWEPSWLLELFNKRNTHRAAEGQSETPITDDSQDWVAQSRRCILSVGRPGVSLCTMVTAMTVCIS